MGVFDSNTLHALLNPMTYWLLSPLVIALGLGAISLVVEDVALLFGIALLHHDESLSMAIFLGLFFGILCGDFLLYAAGRWLKNLSWVDRLIQKPKARLISHKINQHMLPMLLLSRIIPASRLPTFITAGIVRTPFIRFSIIIIPSVLLWVSFILYAGLNLTQIFQDTLQVSPAMVIFSIIGLMLFFTILKQMRASI